jgi:putative component of membrane protein insertase Oxa1/YidC/SpoIIIJ protein YidD
MRLPHAPPRRVVRIWHRPLSNFATPHCKGAKVFLRPEKVPSVFRNKRELADRRSEEPFPNSSLGLTRWPHKRQQLVVRIWRRPLSNFATPHCVENKVFSKLEKARSVFRNKRELADRRSEERFPNSLLKQMRWPRKRPQLVVKIWRRPLNDFVTLRCRQRIVCTVRGPGRKRLLRRPQSKGGRCLIP